ncbi:hypothetical protein [Novipirellula artificiosorum]|uniref:Cytochrome C n=1 Tax=Novipirellula artificiosorum TaxID=2528016 RepID=A0A5C6DNV9_9BACT|nr:hypothetical protein [Novipirellula artificiosorum]TWU38408.1 hypothetical protein Poly41_28840 [Novipirellula artificiosorum]
MNRTLVTLVVVSLACFTWRSATSVPPTGPADQPAKPLEKRANPKIVVPLMHMKLDHSKAILEGLTMEDYDAILTNASALKVLSMESGWNVVQTEEYTTQSRDFQRTAQLIVDAAKEKDMSRATLGYVAMTVRCVECHSYMRKLEERKER